MRESYFLQRVFKATCALVLAVLLLAGGVGLPAMADDKESEADKYLSQAIAAFDAGARGDTDLNLARAYFYLDRASKAGNIRAHLVLGELMSQKQDLEGKLRAVSLFELYARNVPEPPAYVLAKIEEIRELMRRIQETGS